MEIIQGNFLGLQSPRPLDVLTIGKFDGLHLGHQALLRRGTEVKGERGTFGLLTFRPHPWELFSGQSRPPIMAFDHWVSELEKFGVTHLFIQDFTQEISRLPAKAFCEKVLNGLVETQFLVVGHDFSFGHGSSGGVADLKSHLSHNPSVEVVSPIELGVTRVSSTAVREHLAAGAVDIVGAMLGRPYATEFQVVRGRGLARSLGFPTANLSGGDLYYPGSGVYLVRARWGETWHWGVLNSGERPTLIEKGGYCREVHFPGFSGDLYGKTLWVQWERKLRDEKKFSSKKQLVRQVEDDIAACVAAFNSK